MPRVGRDHKSRASFRGQGRESWLLGNRWWTRLDGVVLSPFAFPYQHDEPRVSGPSPVRTIASSPSGTVGAR